MKYPKIKTLYKRDPNTFKIITSQLRCPEFALVHGWLITEKVDGTNIRVILTPDGKVEFKGRTDKAQTPVFLLDTLKSMLPSERLQSVFEQDEQGHWPLCVLYGEGYGVKIQRGGKYRKEGVSFRLFDVRIGDWWLNWDSVRDIADKLSIKTVPVLEKLERWLPTCKAELQDLFALGNSVVAWQDKGVANIEAAEGIVARTDPLLFDRRGNRVMWKLKFKDF